MLTCRTYGKGCLYFEGEPLTQEHGGGCVEGVPRDLPKNVSACTRSQQQSILRADIPLVGFRLQDCGHARTQCQQAKRSSLSCRFDDRSCMIFVCRVHTSLLPMHELSLSVSCDRYAATPLMVFSTLVKPQSVGMHDKRSKTDALCSDTRHLRYKCMLPSTSFRVGFVRRRPDRVFLVVRGIQA
jgi:hypothetical protein